LLLLGHSAADELDKRILQGRLAFLHTSDLAAGPLDHSHDAAECGVAGQLKTESVNTVLLGDARGGDACDGAQRVQEPVAGTQLEINDRVLLDLLLQL